MAALVGISVAVGCDGKGFDPAKDPPKTQALSGASLAENRSVLTACLGGMLKEPPSAKDLELIFGPPGTDLTKDLTRNGVPDDADALVCAEILGDQSALWPDTTAESGERFLDVLARSDVSDEIRDRAHFLRALLHWRKFILWSRLSGCINIQTTIGGLRLTNPLDACEKGGFAKCAIEASRSLGRIENRDTFFYSPTRIPATKSCGDDDLTLHGAYDPASLRGLGVVSSGYAALFHFAYAHFDINRTQAAAANMLSGGLDFPSGTRPWAVAEWLSLIESLRPLVTILLETPLDHEHAKQFLDASREATISALWWWTWVWGPWLPSHPKPEDAAGFPLTWEDRDRSGKLDACDALHLNVGSMAESIVRLIFTSGVLSMGMADVGCSDVPPETFFLPKFMFGREIDYGKVAAAAGVLLSAMRDHLASSEGPPLTAKHLSPLLTAIGWPPAEDTFELFPRVLFEKGLSVFLPAGDAAGRFAIEAEINGGMPSEPEAKSDLAEPLGRITADDPYIYKTVRKEGMNWFDHVTRGDGPHFRGVVPTDHISVSEARLDLDGATEKNAFRVKRGGGFLPYVRFADPTLGGLIRVSPEFTRALTDPDVPVCDRTLSIPRAPTNTFGPMDDFSVNILLGTAVMQSTVCYDFLKEVMCAGEFAEAGVGVTTPASAPPTTPISGNPPTVQCDSTKSLWPLDAGGYWSLWATIPFGEKRWPAAAWSISVDQVPPGVPGTAVIGFSDDFSFIPESCDARWYVSEKPLGILMHGADAGVFCGGRVISPAPALLFPAPAASRPLKECAGWKVIDSNASAATPAGNFQGAIRYQAPFWTFGSNAVEMWLCPGVGPVEIYIPGQRGGVEPFIPEMDLPPLLLQKYPPR